MDEQAVEKIELSQMFRRERVAVMEQHEFRERFPMAAQLELATLCQEEVHMRHLVVEV